VRKAGGFIVAHAPRTSGPKTTRRRSSNPRRRTCICRSRSRYGQASGRAIYCACRGLPMTESTSGLSSRRPALGSLFRSVRLSRSHWIEPQRQSTFILTTADGKPWTSDGFRASWRKASAKAGIVGITFNDLRGTAVTRLALAGCTEAEIATITGHSLRDVRSILDAHYLHRDPALAESAIQKLERRTESPK